MTPGSVAQDVRPAKALTCRGCIEATKGKEVMSHSLQTFFPAMIFIASGLAIYLHWQRVGARVEHSQRTLLAKNTEGIDYTFDMG